MRRFLLPVFFVSLVSWFTFAYIIFFTPPEIGGELIQVNFIYFFSTGWFATSSTVGLLLYFVSFLFEDSPKKHLDLEAEHRPRKVFRTSLRRGAMFASALFGFGLLKINDLDNVLNSAFVIGIALLLEVYFSSRWINKNFLLQHQFTT